MNDILGIDQAAYEEAKKAIYTFVETADLGIPYLDRAVLEKAAVQETSSRHKGGAQSLERLCINMLRHGRSKYEDLIRRLNRPREWPLDRIGGRVLHVEKQRLALILKKRVLDTIATMYPWLRDECEIMKGRKGIEDDPGKYVVPFNPFKGKALAELSIDHLHRLLGFKCVQKALRSRFERHLEDRLSGKSAMAT